MSEKNADISDTSKKFDLKKTNKLKLHVHVYDVSQNPKTFLKHQNNVSFLLGSPHLYP